MSYIWSFSPDTPEVPSVRDSYEKTKPKKRKEPSWTAPEHQRLAQDMKRDYPRNELGVRIPGKGRELKVDARPTIMLPPRPTKLGWL